MGDCCERVVKMIDDVVLPSILKPDEDLSLAELDLICQLDTFFAGQERLPDKSVLHRVQLSSAEHRPAAAPAAAVAMTTRTWLPTPDRRLVVCRRTLHVLTRSCILRVVRHADVYDGCRFSRVWRIFCKLQLPQQQYPRNFALHLHFQSKLISFTVSLTSSSLSRHRHQFSPLSSPSRQALDKAAALFNLHQEIHSLSIYLSDLTATLCGILVVL